MPWLPSLGSNGFYDSWAVGPLRAFRDDIDVYLWAGSASPNSPEVLRFVVHNTVDSKKMEYGARASCGGVPPVLGFGVVGQPYPNFPFCVGGHTRFMGI